MNTQNLLPVRFEEIDGVTNSAGTYFRTSDVTPYINNNELIVYSGRYRKCSVNSRIGDLAEGIVKVEVIGWHKHNSACHGPTGGTFYFVREGSEWVRRTANAKAVKAALAK